MVITNNIQALNSSNIIKYNTREADKNNKRLASGYRINSASDDAAGLSISERMRWQIRGLNRASDNIQDGISVINVADGALEEVTQILQRQRELAVQGANDTNTNQDRENIQKEIDQLVDGIEKVFSDTTFNEHKLFKARDIILREYNNNYTEQIKAPIINENNAGKEGTYVTGPVTTYTTREQLLKEDEYGRISYKLTYSTIDTTISVKRNTDTTEKSTTRNIQEHIIEHQPEYIMIQSGSTKGNAVAMRLYNLSVTDMKLDKLSVKDNMHANASMYNIDDSLQRVNSIRSYYGALSNRLEHQYNINQNISENTQNTESRIRDTEYGEEILKYHKNSIITQSASAMLAQNNRHSNDVLRLLK